MCIESDDTSIQFWQCMLEQEVEQARALLDAALNQSDDMTRILASAFYELASPDNLTAYAKDIYRALLIQFHFGHLRDDYIAQTH